MLSPQKQQNERNEKEPPTPTQKIPLQRGLFAHGIWHCNCRDRAPAVKLQTRNQGVNHGRWFYTCQRRPQSNQNCGFFLWSSDAEVREKDVLFGQSREGDGGGGPSTPSSSRVRRSEPWVQSGGGGGGGGLLTPQTERRASSHFDGYGYDHDYPRLPGSYPGSYEVSGRLAGASASAKAKAQMMAEDEIDNPGIRQVSSFTDRLRRASGQSHGGGQDQEPQRQRQERLESFFSKQDSPRKTPRTNSVTSPGKRKRGSESDIENEGDEVLQTQRGMEQTTPTGKRLSDPFLSSPLQPLPQSQSFDICQTPTPTKYTNPLTTSMSSTQQSPSQSQPAAAAATTLATQVLTLLERKGVVIAHSTQEELSALLKRYEMKMQGAVRGRDVTRMALKKKEEEVELLRGRVAQLELELKDIMG